MEQKTKIYEGIACVETSSRTGHVWWYQGASNAFSPLRIEKIKFIRHGILETTSREVLAVRIRIDGTDELVALNLPRTDIPALKKRGLWPPEMEASIEKPTYTPWPKNPVFEF